MDKTDWLIRGANKIAKDPKTGQLEITEVIKSEPKMPEAYFYLGLALHQRGNIKSAIKAYRLAIKKDEQLLNEARNNLAQDLLLIGKYNEGWKLYEHRLEKMKDGMQIYNKMFGKMANINNF